jgi:pilus assembly protein Flp/PilA
VAALRESSRGDVGASAVEYGLIIFAIAALIATVAFAFGGTVSNLFDSSCKTIASQASPSSPDCQP